MQEYTIKQEVYYLHRITGDLISRTELKDYMSIGTDSIFLKDESKVLEYNIYEIPFNDDWEVHVVEPQTLNVRDLQGILTAMFDTRLDDIQENALIKLRKNLERIHERRVYFGRDIPTFSCLQFSIQ